MAANLNIKVLGVEEAIGKIQAYELAKTEQVKKQVNTSALKVQRGAKQRCAVDTGRLRSSIAMEPYNGGLTIEVGTDVKYAPYIEFGTGPRVSVPGELTDYAAQFKGRGGGMAPPGALLGWMRTHGIPESAEFVIRRAIAKKGIKAQPFLFPAWEQERPEYIAKLKEIL